ncbi:major facilitator super transporter protein [Vermiconidia calcicola]|uniref:Major facilitator super transporter protein n=1 Tax=Vermiconidia calcicola TaxID=1690605 RepID=A0ACC3NES0_9PEZI|nr:major facilitator super transporter protein [Vermiconidia calcicola]
MARSRATRLVFLTLSNVLLPIAVLVFASGFFPYKPFLPGLATLEDDQELRTKQPEAVFDRVVFMVVDALRSDFVYGYNSGFEFTQSLIRSGVAIPFTAHATPPTVTMPRVKALTTGSVPSFFDLILNFAESDTSSSLAAQDTWLAQIRAKGGKLVFYGDDTWLKLFPGDFFERSDGTSSFFVSDFTEVDNNVTRHVPDELARGDWNAMIMHYLGLDHVGHKTGPQGPNMLPKQREMDAIVKQIYEAMESHEHHSKTLLVLAGDHGMNAGGNHGGSGPGETEPALLFASPRFKNMKKRRGYECPTVPKEGTEFHYYTKVEQNDLVPTLAGMMAMPVSKNSLGVQISEMAALWSKKDLHQLLFQNARQLVRMVHAKYGESSFGQIVSTHADPTLGPEWQLRPDSDEKVLAQRWARMLKYLSDGHDDAEEVEKAFYGFLNDAQRAMSDTASSYDIPSMGTGMAIVGLALVLAILSLPSIWPPSFAGIFFATTSLLYGVVMFASSYVEEEQHFWYWLTPAWIALLVAKALVNRPSTGSRLRVAAAGVVLLCVHRLAIRWNQTGQKHAGEPDIVHAFFPEHHILLWVLIMLTYLTNAFLLHNRTFAGIFMPEITAFAETALTFLGIVFKLNFTQADAPELVQGLAVRIREWSEPFDLVMQARGVFAVILASTLSVVVLSIHQARTKTTSISGSDEGRILLPERLYHLLTLFLMTQTRAPNVPLFLALEMQRASLNYLIFTEDSDARTTVTRDESRTTQVVASVLLLSHVSYFCMGGSNSISSVDLSNAYNGVADYNIAAVGVLLFASNWAGPIWWCSAAVLLIISERTDPASPVVSHSAKERGWVMAERQRLHGEAVASTQPKKVEASGKAEAGQGSWTEYVSSMTAFVSCSLLAVMAACTALRTHLFIWTVFSPKYLYALAWSLGWHVIVNIGLGSLLYWLRWIA